MQGANMDAQASRRLRDHLNHTMRTVTKAQQRLRSADIDDEDAAVGITQLIEEAQEKHEAVRQQMGSYGVTVPISTGLTDTLGNTTGMGRKMQMERQIGDIQAACEQLQDMFDQQIDYQGDYDEERSSSGRQGFDDKALSADTVSGIRAGEDDSDDDESQQVMTPRGVYVNRCLPMTKQDLAEEGETYKTWLRMTRVSVLGLVVFLLYLVASIAYLAARCYYSLSGLGDFLWYGAIVLAAEMASVLSLVFYGLWLCGRTDQSDMIVKTSSVDAENMRRLYVVRVFVLCKGENLSLVRRTIASIKNANGYMPEGCELKIYLLDESKDQAKRDFFMSGKTGADVIYIAPPVRNENTKVKNWRADIMNFTLSLIYPSPDEDGYKNIPATELVCVINADQTCSSSFFINLMRYVDCGDDIAVALCPRICYNVHPDCDIFDHQRVAYYEKTQLGMDAYGFTACMFTNMLLRARALQEVGWFPSGTLSENWELGMKLRSAGWKSRYVPEYATIGASPEEICEAYDQHYRHSRGFFQTFWSSSCPFLNRDLGIFYRFMYASRCFLNFASGVWTPIFTLVPIVHLIFGVFPLKLTIHVVVTMMAHYSLRVIMLHLCDSFKQMRALWLSRIAVSLHWWSDLKATLFVPAKNIIGPETSFRSRSWSDAVPTRNMKALVWPFIFVILLLTAFIGGLIHLDTVVNLPIVLSLCLCVINFAPPFLVIMHWNFGPGRFLARLCTLFMILSWVAGIAAMVFLWLLYPRSVDYARAANLSLTFLDAQRSGAMPPGAPDWRFDSGEQNQYVVTFQNETSGQISFSDVDLSGGFYNDGDVGPIKITWNIAMTTTMLAWSLLENQDFWSKDESVQNHALALLAHGVSYIESCYIPTNIVNLETGQQGPSSDDVIIYVVGTARSESQEWRRPKDITELQFIGDLLLDSSPSDLAGQMAAALTAASLALVQYEISLFETSTAYFLIGKAHRLFSSAVFGPGIYTEAFNGTDTGLEEFYPSFAFGDDLFWAASWLFRASNNNIRTANRTYYYKAMQLTKDLAFQDLDVPGASWDYVNNMALVHASTQARDLNFHEPAQSFLWDWICDESAVQYTRNGRAYFYQNPHLGSTATVAAMAAIYVKTSKDWSLVSEKKDLVKGLECFAVEQARYLLGGQVTGWKRHKPFMMHYDDRTYTRTWHRGATCPKYPEPCDISYAYAKDAADVNPITGALLWNPIFEDFPEDVRGRNTTVVSLENNMAVPMLFAAVEDQNVDFSECLNLQSTHFRRRPICRMGRPMGDRRLGPQQAAGQESPEFQGLYQDKEKQDDRIPPPPPPSPRAIV